MIRVLRDGKRTAHRDATFLLGREEFSRVIQLEGRRAQRSGGSFTVVGFTHRGACGETARASLAATLQRRLRETDVAGLLPDGRVGVLLPDTSAPGARTFADAIVRQSPGELGLAAEVYVHSGSDTPPVLEVAAQRWERSAPSCGTQQLEPVLAQPLPLWKRGLDIVLATAALVLLWPVMLAAAVAVKCTSTGPILFRQWRSGLGGKPFVIYKFRTMCADAEQRKAELLARNEQDGPAFKIRSDPRVTKVGRYLRRTCVDELPQLWNVIRGDMTLVGPRPLPCHETDACQSWQRRRLEVTPGLTCIWQVDGGTRVSFVEWMRMDIRYIKSRHLWGDLKLLWSTAVKVVLHRASH